MKVTINGSEIKFDEPKRIIDLIDNKDFKYMAANVNNRARELNYIVKDNDNIELLDLTSSIVISDSSAFLLMISTFCWVFKSLCIA